LCAGLAAAPALAQMPKYGVTVKADEKTDFSKFKTYTWEHGWQAYDKGIHDQIMTSVDRELAAAGLTKRDTGTGDLIVTYASLRRIDVDINAKPDANGVLPRSDVGTLVVLLLEPGTRKELFRARVDRPIEGNSDQVKGTVDAVVKEMFAKYPTKTKK